MKDSLEDHISCVEYLSFHPPVGLTSPHLQTILPTFFSRAGEEPPSAPFFIQLEDGDNLYCKISTPPDWKSNQKTVLMVHGLGGSDSSSYMIRMSRKFYHAGYRSVRINLRGAGQGIYFAQRPYHGGTSDDIFKVIQTLKKETPDSPIAIIGFSLGGNVTLKLLGELGKQAGDWIEKAISVCTPVDLAQTMKLLFHPSNHIYHQYYVKGLRRMGARWIGKHTIQSVLDFDHVVTAPRWGFRDAYDYYQQCSSKFFLPHIRQNCHLIFAKDDPFIDYHSAIQIPLPSAIKIYLSQYGGHMGFWGWAGKKHGYHWLDPLLLKIVG